MVKPEVAGTVVPDVAPSGLCSEGAFGVVLGDDSALDPSFSMDIDEGPLTHAMKSEKTKSEERFLAGSLSLLFKTQEICFRNC